MERLLLVAAAALALFVPRPVHASCAPVPATLLWTYPANDATGVPTNADLWVSGGVFSSPHLGDRALLPNGHGGFDLGELEPNKRYEVTWQTSDKPLSIAFTTGAGPLAEPSDMLALSEPPSIVRDPAGAEFCKLVPPQDCFDTGAPTRVRFDAGGPAAVAWSVMKQRCDGTVTPMVWPAECGLPIVDVAGNGIACATLLLTDGVHVSRETKLYCSVPVLPPGITLPNSGCSPWPPANAITPAMAEVAGAEAAIPSAAAGEPAASPMKPAAHGCGVKAARSDAAGSWAWLVLALCLRARRRRRA